MENCKHKNLKFLEADNLIACLDCGKTWGQKELYTPYIPYTPCYPSNPHPFWGEENPNKYFEVTCMM